MYISEKGSCWNSTVKGTDEYLLRAAMCTVDTYDSGPKWYYPCQVLCMGNAIIERVSRLVSSRLVSVARFAYKTQTRASPVITVEVTGYWLTLLAHTGALPGSTVHPLDWLPSNMSVNMSTGWAPEWMWMNVLVGVNREAITSRGKNVMRYYHGGFF